MWVSWACGWQCGGGRQMELHPRARQCLPMECKQALKASLRRRGYCNIISSVVLKIENQ